MQKLTAKQLIDGGYCVNGRQVDAVFIGQLAKHNVLPIVGQGDKPARGKTPALYGVTSFAGFIWTDGAGNKV
jgi:hypothetical protein